MNFSRMRWTGVLAVVLMLSLGGCRSRQDTAIEQAKKQAATTGQQQQIVTTDKNGNTVTTVVQPPVPGQNGQVVTTTVTPKQGSTQPGTAASKVQGEQVAAAGVQSAAGVSPMAIGGTPGVTPAPGAGDGPTPAPPPAPAPPAPEVHVSKGTALAIRIDQAISAKDTDAGARFTGQVVDPVSDSSGNIVISKRSPVTGVVDVAEGRGHFKGAASLELRLTSVTVDGRRYSLETREVVRSKKGKGKRTGAFIGGGTGLGALIGGLAGGGKGALIGGLAGAGAGTVGAGATGNRDLVIPAESVLRFRLAHELVMHP